VRNYTLAASVSEFYVCHVCLSPKKLETFLFFSWRVVTWQRMSRRFFCKDIAILMCVNESIFLKSFIINALHCSFPNIIGMMFPMFVKCFIWIAGGDH